MESAIQQGKKIKWLRKDLVKKNGVEGDKTPCLQIIYNFQIFKCEQVEKQNTPR